MRNPGRSTLVTVVGWIFLIFSGFGLFGSIMQNLMINLVFPLDEMRAAIPPEAPAAVAWMIDHIQLVFFVPLLACTAVVASSIGLIRRREWGRRSFVAVLALAALWCLVSVGLQMAMGVHMAVPPEAGEMGQRFQAIFNAIQFVGAMIGIGMSALFGWLALQLCSWPIKREFRGAAALAR
jgi:hypothetical protein